MPLTWKFDRKPGRHGYMLRVTRGESLVCAFCVCRPDQFKYLGIRSVFRSQVRHLERHPT